MYVFRQWQLDKDLIKELKTSCCLIKEVKTLIRECSCALIKEVKTRWGLVKVVKTRWGLIKISLKLAFQNPKALKLIILAHEYAL